MPPDFEAFYLRHCRAIYRVCFAFLKNASPVQGELLAVRLTEGLSGVAGPFWGDLCSDSNPAGADAPLCAATQGNRGGSPQPPVGHDDPACRPSSPRGA